MNLYSIYDKATNSFGQLWSAHNDNAAKRAFEKLCATPETDISFRPKDYQLFAIGQFDEKTGALSEGHADITPPLSS